MKNVWTVCLFALGLLATGCAGELVGGSSLEVLDEHQQPLAQYGPGVGKISDTAWVELRGGSGDVMQSVDLVRGEDDGRWYTLEQNALEQTAPPSGIGTVEQGLTMQDYINMIKARAKAAGITVVCSAPGQLPCGAMVCVGTSNPNATMYGSIYVDTGKCKYSGGWIYTNGKLSIL